MEEMIEDKKWLVLLLMKSFCISASAKLIINFLQHLDELSAVEWKIYLKRHFAKWN